MRHGKKPEDYNDDCCRNRDRNSQLSSAFRTEKIQRTNAEDCTACKGFGMRHTQVLKRGQGTDRGGHDVVCYQQKSYRKSSSSFIYPFVLLKDGFGFRRKFLDTFLKPISATGSRLCSSTELHPQRIASQIAKSKRLRPMLSAVSDPSLSPKVDLF